MAKIEVSISMLNRLLFEESLVDITAVSSFDRDKNIITFEIEGAIVPEVEQVRAEVTQAYKTIKFVPVVQKEVK